MDKTFAYNFKLIISEKYILILVLTYSKESKVYYENITILFIIPKTIILCFFILVLYLLQYLYFSLKLTGIIFKKLNNKSSNFYSLASFGIKRGIPNIF